MRASDCVVETHDLAHTLDRLGRGIVDALDAATEHRRLRQCRDLHTRGTSVDAIGCGAIDLPRQVEPLRWRADQFEILRLLERHLVGDRQAGRIGGKPSVRQASSRRIAWSTLPMFCATATGLSVAEDLSKRSIT